MDSTEDWYERNQRHNTVTQWLHSFRYRHALRAVRDISLFGRRLNVVDIGCGHGKLYDLLAPEFDIDYTGIEIDADFAALARSRHVGRKNFTLIQESALTALERCGRPDAVMALETFEHIPERDVVRLIEQIAEIRPKLLFVSVPVEIGPAIWLKNVGSLVCGYSRHSEYTWPETFWAGIYKLDKLPPHGTLHKGFDWRWLAQTIRQNMRIRETITFPFSFLPAAVSSSICFIAEPR